MSGQVVKVRSPRNRTITLSDADRERLRVKVITADSHTLSTSCLEGIVLGDMFDWAPRLPDSSVDLLILDPPYNLSKEFHGHRFSKREISSYTHWLNSVVEQLVPLLTESASVYICGDWLTSHSIYEVASKYFKVRNRITWEREKGRGATTNWKNSAEDIWYCTVSDNYVFNVDVVKMRRRVLAPYRTQGGRPKDWQEGQQGRYRDTFPSNFWNDITVPFWSMPENTDHPTQKSEKLMAKLILASSKPGALVLDPFVGSGTTPVVAKKLGRRFLGIELVEEYCLLAARRLELADQCTAIQGYANGVFWERNTLAEQRRANCIESDLDLFEGK